MGLLFNFYSLYLFADEIVVDNNIENPICFEKNIYNKTTYDRVFEYSKSIFNSYIKNKDSEFKFLDLNTLCINNKAIQSLVIQSLHTAFFEGTYEKLMSFKGQHLQSFMKIAKKRWNNPKELLFKLSGYTFGSADAPYKAGYHRGGKRIYMDISQIPSSEWFIIFIHELTHAMDDQMMNASNEFSSLNTLEEIKDLIGFNYSKSELNDKQKRLISKWIKSGFKRDLLAEYRAWVITYVIYKEGLENKLWSEVPWLEELVPNNSISPISGFEIEKNILNFLFSNSSDPIASTSEFYPQRIYGLKDFNQLVKALLGSQLIQEQIQIEKADLEKSIENNNSNSYFFDLGNLEPIIKSN